jgi:transcription termination factor Rho
MSEEVETTAKRKPRARKTTDAQDAKAEVVSTQSDSAQEPSSKTKAPAKKQTSKEPKAKASSVKKSDASKKAQEDGEDAAAKSEDATAKTSKAARAPKAANVAKAAKETKATKTTRSAKAAKSVKSDAAKADATNADDAANASAADETLAANLATEGSSQTKTADTVAEAAAPAHGKRTPRRGTAKKLEEAANAAVEEQEPSNVARTENQADGTSADATEGEAKSSQENADGATDQQEPEQQGGKKNKNKQNGHNSQGQNQKDNRNGRHQRRQHQPMKEVLPSISKEELAEMKVGDLREKAAEYAIDASGLRKSELVDVIFDALCKAEGIVEVHGILDIMNDGYGFMRTRGYLPSEADAYVSLSIIRRNGLRKGDYIVGQTRPARDNEKYAAIQKIISINDVPAEEVIARPRFADLTPIYPDERLVMEHGKSAITARVIDLVSPIGKGQRGLFVSPPKAGKTTVLKDVAAAISANNPEVHLMCLLVDERPEEVTDMERSIKGEVISSTFDMPCENHIAVAELVIERAKRLVEQGQDVVILLDSITRLARAYNMAQPASGRVLSGGVDSTALYPPKRFLGAARNIENGGSLTILGTALIETGSKMDEVIFEEFKGTGNMELKLDRALADRRIYPAIDVVASGTRKEELLMNQQEAPLIWAVRRVLSNMNSTERATDTLIKSLKQTNNNQEFLIRFAKKAQSSGAGSADNFNF